MSDEKAKFLKDFLKDFQDEESAAKNAALEMVRQEKAEQQMYMMRKAAEMSRLMGAAAFDPEMSRTASLEWSDVARSTASGLEFARRTQAEQNALVNMKYQAMAPEAAPQLGAFAGLPRRRLDHLNVDQLEMWSRGRTLELAILFAASNRQDSGPNSALIVAVWQGSRTEFLLKVDSVPEMKRAIQALSLCSQQFFIQGAEGDPPGLLRDCTGIGKPPVECPDRQISFDD